MYFKKYIAEFNNCLNLKTISTLIKFSSTRDFHKAAIGTRGVINENIRKVLMYPLTPLNKSITDCHWARFLNFKLTSLMNKYIEMNNLLPYLGIPNLNQLDILKYEETYHYQFHIDGGYDSNRTLSAIVFLNNDYEGGELCFKTLESDKEFSIKPYPGKIIIWPGNFFFPHSVKPIKNGTRYTIVAWA